MQRQTEIGKIAMNRLTIILSPLFLLGLFKMAFGWLLPPGLLDAAPRLGYSVAMPQEPASLRSKLIRWVLDNYGIDRVTDDEMLHITIAVLVYSAVYGLGSNAVLRERGFGPPLNGIVCFVGACCGLVGCARSGMAFTPDRFALVVVVVVLASTALLLALALGKTWVLALWDRFMSGGAVLRPARDRDGDSIAARRLAAIGGKDRR